MLLFEPSKENLDKNNLLSHLSQQTMPANMEQINLENILKPELKEERIKEKTYDRSSFNLNLSLLLYASRALVFRKYIYIFAHCSSVCIKSSLFNSPLFNFNSSELSLLIVLKFSSLKKNIRFS
jgi:hypothetical protein